ncbi:MAG: hypothetical protein V4582_10560 [Pseudomonadota bacterium]
MKKLCAALCMIAFSNFSSAATLMATTPVKSDAPTANLLGGYCLPYTKICW